MVNKKCANGESSFAWEISFSSKDTLKTSNLYHQTDCLYKDASHNIQRDGGTINVQRFKGGIEVSDTFIEKNLVATNHDSEYKFTFFSGGAQLKILYSSTTDTTTPKRINDLKINYNHTRSDRTDTICINRIAGFPTVNKHKSDCLQ